MKKSRPPKRPKRLRQKTFPVLAFLSVGFLLLIASLTAITLSGRKGAPQGFQNTPLSNLDDTILVPTPARPIARGERLKDLEYVETRWPRSRVSGSYITDISHYVDAVALIPLAEHVPISLSSITNDSIEANAVVEGIPEGMRAITVRVDIESAVEGWAQSGNYVDVIVIRASPETAAGLETKVIAENVKILSAGRAAIAAHSGDTAPQAPATVTLLTSQEDALKIKTAAALGKLTFALRAKNDTAPTLSLAMNQKSLLGSTQVPSKKSLEFKGYARDAQGKLYVLEEHGHWIRAKNLPQEFDLRTSEKPTQAKAETFTEKKTSLEDPETLEKSKDLLALSREPGRRNITAQ